MAIIQQDQRSVSQRSSGFEAVDPQIAQILADVRALSSLDLRESVQSADSFSFLVPSAIAAVARLDVGFKILPPIPDIRTLPGACQPPSPLGVIF
ncbi:MAG: hypothetical protein WD042_04360 [Phycisphaeraceae bacterium]